MRLIITLFVCSFILSACSKSETGCVQKTPAEQKSEMIAYCTANGINYTEHSSGILYEIISPGLGATPNLESKIFVFYEGKLLSGTTFDRVSDPTRTGWQLKGLIEGWRVMLPLIKQGGRIKMVIPSSLAYGCTGSGSIPSNSPLYFDITLTLVQ